MNTPARVRRQREESLPAPELVSLIDDPSGPYADSPEGWWTEYGGALDVRSGVVYLPPTAPLPPCPFPCRTCRAKGRQ
ncbi:hypothetical protein [Streptomyces sp. NPDC018000]|uniref:hypothetical protein n=1 Tax=Streptomyces sp. NPDC018000 TaxID=3365028 RepID=UPI00378811FE